eukprot:TRINITY_DN49_c0_g1_i2.p1 TRINITY_DN49_c0_g1~~TRINITY_DN49_c0_g1_i2.p1  ORF type:complete len:431 (-),score=107.48 TRINITY_DN49_c0_g1_i2:740-1858(-)
MPQASVTSMLNEVKLLRELDHPNVLKILGEHSMKENIYLFLEFAENGSLFRLIKEFKNVPEVLTAFYMDQVCSALAYLHSRGVIHRDIKAANILLMGDARLVKIADFGVAAVLEDGNKHFTVVGSPYWMAPEVISESGHNTLSDIWSLACTIYELLTGMPPYFKVNPMTAMFKIVQSPIPIPEHISAEMRDLFSYCFRKAPQERPPAADLLTHPWFAKAKEGPLAAAFRNMKDYASMRDVIAQCAAQQGAAPVVPSPVKAPQVKSPVPQSPIDFTGCGSPPDHERSLSPDPESVDQEKERSSGSGSGSSGNGTWSKDNGKDSHKHKLHHHHGQARGPSAANPLESFFQPPHSQQPLRTFPCTLESRAGLRGK